MRRALFEVLAVLLIGGSLLFFKECAEEAARRNYVGAIILLAVGLSVITVGKELARLALAQRE